ncbi:MAG TPA: hypothetical protein PLF13_14390 [candidate division Zixibacteria bacterium]|nr:hypothetical protein [candidate division Zixibacteria bacterium]
MRRTPNMLVALIIWAIGSSLLALIYLLSLNYTVIVAALIVIAVALIGSVAAYAANRRRWACFAAGVPAFLAVCWFLIFVVVYFFRSA